MAHLRTFIATFAERYASMVDRKRFVVFGEPSDELRAVLDSYGATYYDHSVASPIGPKCFLAAEEAQGLRKLITDVASVDRQHINKKKERLVRARSPDKRLWARSKHQYRRCEGQ